MSNHRKIISWIHIMRTKRFAIHEVRDAVGVSASTATRVLRKLIDLKLVTHHAHSAAKRNYSVSSRWPNDVKDAWENYELAKVLHI